MKELERPRLPVGVDIIKKKSSSGTLIIKKKVGVVNDAGIGFNDSSSRLLYNSRIDHKKLPRAVPSDDESSDYEPQFRRKVEKFDNSTSSYSNVGFTESNRSPRFVGNRESSDQDFPGSQFRRKVEKFDNGTPFTENREFRAPEMVNNGSGGVMGNREFRAEKRVNSRVDEYDDNGYPERIRININTQVPLTNLNSYGQNEGRRESGSGSGMRIYDKRRDFVNDDRGSVLGGQSSRFDHHGIRRGYEMDHGESRLPSSGFQVSDKPIRLQGKNGVLKVMVKKHKPIPVPYQSYVHPVEVEERREARPEVYAKKEVNVSLKSYEDWDAAGKKKTVIGSSSLYSSSKHPEIPIASKSKEKREIKMVNNDMVTPSPLKLSRVDHSSAEKMVKVEKKVSPPTEFVTPVKGKESKVKRGTGTEKQLLREKIKSMILGAGWTIDYRPRRNRDYQDAVYINPAGTAYWSIIKAYEALQKEERDLLQAVGDFTPLPVETLSKLTRQTKKKIEREMKKKRRDEGVSRKRDRTEVSAETSKRRLEEASEDSGDESNDSYYRKSAIQERAAMRTGEGLNSRKLGRRTLLVRCEGKVSANDGLVTYPGKRTLLSWLIESGTVQLGEKVQYMNIKKRRVLKEGWITKEGVNCCCCGEILSVLKFELHAGSKLRQPYSNICVQSGKSLTECQINAWNKQGELERKGFHAVYAVGDDPNDDTCGLCGDGGDLICCDGCPSTFHQSCLGIQMLPQGDWHCPNCSCKYCEMATEASVGAESSLLKCNLCEKKYHESCSLKMDDKPIHHTDPNLSFCGHRCLELYAQLQKLLGVKHELDSGFSWSLIHRSELSSDTSSIELSQKVECNSKLAVALSVIDECFLPFIERRSGINLIHNVVYNCGSNSSRLNYSGFFTAILERDDEMICAASIRIHGTQLAEMPFIGTRHMYRRQGMCRRLLSSIESALSSLHVEKLIIPAIAEHMRTWTDVFGFSPLEESHKQEMRSLNMLVFPRTDMLQKPLVHQVTPLDKASTELEGSMPKSQKSEPTSPNVKELSDSGSEDPNVTLDDNASDATPSISSVKNDNPLPVLARKPEVLCDTAVQCDGDDTVMQNSEASTENISQIDPIEAHSDATLSISYVKHDNPLPVSARKPGVLCDSTVQCDGDDTIMQNSEESTEYIAQADPIDAQNAHSDSIEAKDDVQDDDETTNKIAIGDSKVDGFALKNGKVTSPTKTIDVDSIPPQDNSYVLRDSEPSDNPLLLNESVSLDASSGSNVDELVDKIVDFPSDNPCDITGKDVVSVSANSDTNIDVQNSEIADAMVPDIHDQKDAVSPGPPLVALEALQSDLRVATEVQNGKTADLPTDNPCEITGNESVSVSADSDINTDVQNGKNADTLPHETQVPNDAISTALESSGLESLPLDPHVAAEDQNVKFVDLPSDNPCELQVEESASVSADSGIKLEKHVQNATISTKPQSSGLETVTLGPNIAAEVQNEKIAGLPSDNPCEVIGKSFVSVSADSDTNIDMQNSKIAYALPLITHDEKDTISPGSQLVGQESPHLATDVQFSTVEEASNIEEEKCSDYLSSSADDGSIIYI